MVPFYSGGLRIKTCLLDAAFVSTTLRNHPQSFARDRSGDNMAVRVRCLRSFRVASVALRDILTHVFEKVSLSEDELQFSWQVQHFMRSNCIFLVHPIFKAP